MIRVRFLLIVLVVFAVSGCGHKMALTKGQTSIDVSQKSLVLLSVKIANQHKPNYQLDIIGTLICPQSERCGHGSVKYFYKSSDAYKIKSVENSFNEYLLSYELEGGAYQMHSMGAVYDHFPITGGGSVPLNYSLDVKPKAVMYLGHLDIVMRERKTDREERAGNVVPVIDQMTVGTATGTYDVVAEDRFDEDVKLFVSEYPALQKIKIEKAILPQWIRPENRSGK